MNLSPDLLPVFQVVTQCCRIKQVQIQEQDPNYMMEKHEDELELEFNCTG